MIVECIECHTRYRVNELLFRESQRKVRCSKCRHTFVVEKVSRVSCSICGDDALAVEDCMIREYKGSPYALCPTCVKSFQEILEEKKPGK